MAERNGVSGLKVPEARWENSERSEEANHLEKRTANEVSREPGETENSERSEEANHLEKRAVNDRRE